ncbi:unnamed protein product [Penicillium bialowiezense]
MSVEPTGIKTIVVDSVPLLQSVIDAAIEGLGTNSPSLFLDLEGIHLGRHGSISIVSLYVPSRETVYLVDVFKLEKESFSTVNSDGKSLKFILESPDILKVLFDLRNDSDALFSLYGVSLDGIRDVQLMELATRRGSKEFLAGLGKCIVRDSTISAAQKKEWERTKRSTRRLFDPALGGNYEIFNARPIKPGVAKYCAGDVTVYNAQLSRPGEDFWAVQVLKATKERIKLSQTSNYNGHCRSNARGPWDREYIKEATDQWNDEIMENAMHPDDDDDDDDFLRTLEDHSDQQDCGSTSFKEMFEYTRVLESRVGFWRC